MKVYMFNQLCIKGRLLMVQNYTDFIADRCTAAIAMSPNHIVVGSGTSTCVRAIDAAGLRRLC
eukprot:10073118-Ditylum_brightwellii.AAC.1